MASLLKRNETSLSKKQQTIDNMMDVFSGQIEPLLVKLLSQQDEAQSALTLKMKSTENVDDSPLFQNNSQKVDKS